MATGAQVKSNGVTIRPETRATHPRSDRPMLTAKALLAGVPSATSAQARRWCRAVRSRVLDRPARIAEADERLL
jgi:hypothetical protein